MIKTLTYKPTEDAIHVMLGCAANQLIKEQGEAIANAFSQIEVTIEVDDDWGICRILQVNGRDVAQE